MSESPVENDLKHAPDWRKRAASWTSQAILIIPEKEPKTISGRGARRNLTMIGVVAALPQATSRSCPEAQA